MPVVTSGSKDSAGRISDLKDSDNRIKVILIFGPTAVGKTALLEAPVFKNSEIINADSMQVYRGMNIGTAKPEKNFMKRVKHHLIDIREPDEQFHAGDFVALADDLVREISGRGRLPVICGGTGFYFKNFIYGLPDAPPSDEKIRDRLQAEFEREGSEPLYRRLGEIDPEAAARISRNDTYRILRALEVFETSGRPLSDFKMPAQPRAAFDCLVIGLKREREALYERINMRVDMMFEQGLFEEVRRLAAAGCRSGHPGMKGIGYREFFDLGVELEADVIEPSKLEALTELIKRNSRRYAKRQITWFRQLKDIHWFEPDDINGITAAVEGFTAGT